MKCIKCYNNLKKLLINFLVEILIKKHLLIDFYMNKKELVYINLLLLFLKLLNVKAFLVVDLYRKHPEFFFFA